MQNGIIVYEEIIQMTKTLSVNKAHDEIKKWGSAEAPARQLNFQGNTGKNNMLEGSLQFKVNISPNGNYFWLKARVLISMGQDSMKVLIKDFYEKPVEKGVSNDFSKIEYRWWDFRKGKPWSPEDEALFSGLDLNCRQLMKSLQQWINR